MGGSDSEWIEADPYKRQREEWGERKERKNQILDKVPRDLNESRIVRIRERIGHANKKFSRFVRGWRRAAAMANKYFRPLGGISKLS